MTAQRYPAPAKLNLMLRVVGRRDDGYHLLQTLFRFIDHGDQVSLAVRDDGAIRRVREIPGVAEDDDLTVRAARLLRQATGARLGADIGVEKRLPMGAGLGGGSSDAATVLIGLNHLWGTGLTRAELQALGLTLGADVPVFIYGQSALGEGVGEVLTPVGLPPAWYVVLTPPVGVSTAAVFSHRDLKRDSKVVKIQGFSAAGLLSGAVNDLQELVCRLYPEVSRHLKWLDRFGPALMTGSGAAVFSSFETEAAAREVVLQLPPDMKGFAARGLDRHPLFDLTAG
ncbi:MAG TPA: 4-(cytidine 5'-diphospho)-2-C-methyl-D-erythritol kinase [Burkholderiales bacterium]|nr:4-(cytidine 5'-diphospho)-2-C-methyl-D-erythritol kinase [Burkholderiales bacterium]